VTTLLDANILIHAANAASAVHHTAKRLRDQAVEGVLQACLTPQVLWEFYSVITNPRRVDRPLSQELALKEIHAYVQTEQMSLLLPRPSTTKRVLSLLGRYRVTGLRIFDLYLVATMLDYGIHRIYTENVSDFKEFDGIEAVNPLTLVSFKP
jgi:toxin-antitoxin system PIN domain toxin